MLGVLSALMTIGAFAVPKPAAAATLHSTSMIAYYGNNYSYGYRHRHHRWHHRHHSGIVIHL
jgi:hypothetical protein